MKDETKQQLNEEIKKLPKNNQEAISSVDWLARCEEIGDIFSLDGEEIGSLQVEIGLALASVTNPAIIKENIESNVGLTADMAKKITVQVFDKIFIPISKKIEEGVKIKLKAMDIKWDQTIDFVTSGGDYSAFL